MLSLNTESSNTDLRDCPGLNVKPKHLYVKMKQLQPESCFVVPVQQYNLHTVWREVFAF